MTILDPSPEQPLSLAAKVWHHVGLAFRVLRSATYAFRTEEAFIRASSLAFTTLLCIVPLLTVCLRIMNFYGMSEDDRTQLESVISRYLMPTQSRDVIAMVADAASKVTQNVGVFGFLAFVFTLVLMAQELEGHVLKMCHQKATWWKSGLNYLSFAVLAPTAGILCFLILHPLGDILDNMLGTWTHLNYPFMFLVLVVVLMLRTFSNYALSWVACFCGALAGGFAASASWKGCALYFANSASVSAYGALSSIPAFLLWIFVAWCCMLFAAQVAAKTQTAIDGGCQRPQELE